MRVCLYFIGNENARRTHMSLFFVLMRGSNNSILEFAFNYNVALCLYDQNSTQRHIIDSFQSNIKLNSFQPLRSDMNIASGMPKTLLPYALSLKPGLPIHIQQAMIK